MSSPDLYLVSTITWLYTLQNLVACAGSSSLSYSHLMTASWLLRSSQGQPIIALPYIRLMRARVAAGQASLPSMQVWILCCGLPLL